MTRRAFTETVTPRPFPADPVHNIHTAPIRTRKGEPVVTAIWMTASIVTLVLGVALPCLGAIGSPLHGYVVPTVALLYAAAIGGTCTYNRLRYGRVCPNPLPPHRARPQPHPSPVRSTERHATRRRGQTTSRAANG